MCFVKNETHPSFAGLSISNSPDSLSWLSHLKPPEMVVTLDPVWGERRLQSPIKVSVCEDTQKARPVVLTSTILCKSPGTSQGIRYFMYTPTEAS